MKRALSSLKRHHGRGAAQKTKCAASSILELRLYLYLDSRMVSIRVLPIKAGCYRQRKLDARRAVRADQDLAPSTQAMVDAQEVWLAGRALPQDCRPRA